MKRTKPKKRPLQKTYIKEWRKFRDFSQEKLASRLGISHTTLGRIERGVAQYNQSFLEACAEALGCAATADLIMRNPADPEGIWSIWDSLTAPQRRQVVELAGVIRRSGTHN